MENLPSAEREEGGLCISPHGVLGGQRSDKSQAYTTVTELSKEYIRNPAQVCQVTIEMRYL